MKHTTLKDALVTASFLAVLGNAGVASAHTQGGSLGAGAGATDYFQVTCSDDGSGAPKSMVTQILDAAPVAAPLVSVLSNKGLLAANSTDPTDGDAASSPVVSVNGNAGVYNVFISKNAAGAETYTLTVHCMTGTNGTGIHTGTSIAIKQDQ